MRLQTIFAALSAALVATGAATLSHPAQSAPAQRPLAERITESATTMVAAAQP